jgi:hypothetical protein
MEPVFIKELGLVQQPLNIYPEEMDDQVVRTFYLNIQRLYKEEDTDYIDKAMTWHRTLQGEDFWSDAYHTDYELFEGSEADGILRAALAEMYNLTEWSPDLIKELL